MAPIRPFVKLHYARESNSRDQISDLYRLENATGELELAALESHRRGRASIHKPAYEFFRKYARRLDLGKMEEWDTKEDLDKWLDKVIFSSFKHTSTLNMSGCWFYKYICDSDPDAPTAIPQGFETVVGEPPNDFWILLQNGYRVWPVRVLNNQFDRGWAEFHKAHELKADYGVIMGCERRWIFNVSILNGDQEHVLYNWCTPDHDLKDMSVPYGETYTSCLPSDIYNVVVLHRFGFCCVPGSTMALKFQTQLHGIMMERDMDQLICVVGVREWKIPIHDNILDVEAMKNFTETLQIRPINLVFVSVTLDVKAHVLVFNDDGAERTYNWV